MAATVLSTPASASRAKLASMKRRGRDLVTIRRCAGFGRTNVIELQPDREPSAPEGLHTGAMTARENEPGFSVTTHHDSDPAVMVVVGELDSFTACDLRAGVAVVLGRQGTIIDIRQVPFVDSAGLGALVGGIRRLREAGGSVALCCDRSSVLRLLRMTGLDRIVEITGSPAEARQVISGALLPA